jgi:hypothetical protein
MTYDEKNELRQLLVDNLKSTGLTSDDIVLETEAYLDEDAGCHYISKPELIVFQLHKRFAPALVHAYWVFDDMLEMTIPRHFGGRIAELIKLLPASLPLPAYKPHVLAVSHYTWIANDLYEIPKKQAFGYFHKREMNTMNLIEFNDKMDSEIPF